MVKYYYNKYNLITNYRYPEPEWREGVGLAAEDFSSKNMGYSFDDIKNEFTLSNNWWGKTTPVYVGSIAYMMHGLTLYKYVATHNALEAYETITSRYYTKDPTVNWNSPIPVYSRGSLVQSNIQAENGTYPVEGKHTDGFWYERGALINTAPTTPGAFTQPTGALEIGDSKAITWGSSTDAEGNLKNYVLEVSLNGSSWTQIGTQTSVSFTYTIPTCTNIQFRVKAVDMAGLESAYTTSGSFTVTKPKYYYSKYNAQTNYTYTNKPGTEKKITVALEAQYSTALMDVLASLGIPNMSVYQGMSYDGPTCVGSGLLFHDNVSIERLFAAINAGLFMLAKPTGETTLYIIRMTLREGGKYYDIFIEPHTRVAGAPTYSQGTLIQSGIVAEDGMYPNNGRHTDGYWYVRGSRVNASIAPTGPFTSPVVGSIFKPNQSITATFEASAATNISLYEVDYRYNNNAWVPLSYTNALTRPLTTTTDKTLTTLQIRVRAKNTSGVYSDYIYSDVFVVEHNVAPTLTLDTESNKTLYENDTFLIDGSALDKDNGNIVNVKYQLNGGQARAITTEISNGTKPIAFSKQLTFKDGKLYDGDTAITDKLVDGVSHTLKVFAEDDQGGKSAEQTRSFFVVPNRAPAITINPIEKPTGVIDSDKFPVSGTCSDPDGNDVIVSYKINTSLATEVYRGKGGDWTFDVALSSLNIGENIIIVEVTDSHNFKTSKTIKLNKAVKSTPILNSVVRYKIKPPTGSAKGVLLCVQKDKDLNVSAEISMTETGVQEHFVEMPLKSSTPPDSLIAEDVFAFEATEAKDNIHIKLNLSRESDAVDTSINLIWGSLL
ncbi:hypothetical protein [Viridibacillus arvi]|uniref:hypothetical protein n=1 Tax=Viridibacillus arvi TaxID=263475 RepID=UPI0034CE5D37